MRRWYESCSCCLSRCLPDIKAALDAERAAAIEVWNVHYNYHRPHTAAGNQPPASRLHAGVTNVMSQNN